MNIREVIHVLNAMRADGTIERYAIGGAVGATFYLEPVSTVDVDVFVAFAAEPDSLLVSPRRIFDYLTAMGCAVEGEYVLVGGWPVQFLPVPTALVEEALEAAIEWDVSGCPARVFTAEHLAAIALQTGRAKDKLRLLQFVEEGAIDIAAFQSVLERHDLLDRWRQFQRQFLVP